MELKEALETLMAASSSLVHPTFEEARATVKAFIDESLGDNPSPVIVKAQLTNGVIHNCFSTVPVDLTIYPDFEKPIKPLCMCDPLQVANIRD